MGRGVPDYWWAAVSFVTCILRNCGVGITSRRNNIFYLLTEELSFDPQQGRNIFAFHCLKNCLEAQLSIISVWLTPLTQCTLNS
jgi:hypothetical protein